jgi:hypothetical protein
MESPLPRYDGSVKAPFFAAASRRASLHRIASGFCLSDELINLSPHLSDDPMLLWSELDVADEVKRQCQENSLEHEDTGSQDSSLSRAQLNKLIYGLSQNAAGGVVVEDRGCKMATMTYSLMLMSYPQLKFLSVCTS